MSGIATPLPEETHRYSQHGWRKTFISDANCIRYGRTTKCGSKAENDLYAHGFHAENTLAIDHHGINGCRAPEKIYLWRRAAVFMSAGSDKMNEKERAEGASFHLLLYFSFLIVCLREKASASGLRISGWEWERTENTGRYPKMDRVCLFNRDQVSPAFLRSSFSPTHPPLFPHGLIVPTALQHHPSSSARSRAGRMGL